MNVPITWSDDVQHVECHLEADAKWTRKDLSPGTASWQKGMDGEISVLVFVCPCGCGEIGHVPVRAGYVGKPWTWDGNKELPTLSPSILRIKPPGCGWHGHLIKGVFVSC